MRVDNINEKRFGWAEVLLTFVLLFLTSCAFIQQKEISYSAEDYRIVKYTIDDGFTSLQKRNVEKAIEYFEDSVGCVLFLEEDGALSLKIKPMFVKEDRNIGLFKRSTQEVLIFYEETPEIFYKVVLHELAHALGMRGHAFTKEDMDKSQLTPYISKKSSPILYQQDIRYLKDMICKE